MTRANVLNIMLVGLHLAVAIVIVGALLTEHEKRNGEVAVLAQQARLEHRQTEDLRHQVAVQEATLQGIYERDPYVIELLARTRYDYVGLEPELTPPPIPASR